MAVEKPKLRGKSRKGEELEVVKYSDDEREVGFTVSKKSCMKK